VDNWVCRSITYIAYILQTQKVLHYMQWSARDNNWGDGAVGFRSPPEQEGLHDAQVGMWKGVQLRFVVTRSSLRWCSVSKYAISKKKATYNV